MVGVGEGSTIQTVVLCVGKLKEAHWRSAVGEYMKRMQSANAVSVIEVRDESFPDAITPQSTDKVLEREASRLLQHVRERDCLIALAVHGKTYTSQAFAARLAELETKGFGRLVFVIGGSLGLHEQVYRKANELISFSAFTFPHQMMRCLLVEQLYRAVRINQGAPYHR